jgi:thiol-disulfide isomerase/thioredoxin
VLRLLAFLRECDRRAEAGTALIPGDNRPGTRRMVEVNVGKLQKHLIPIGLVLGLAAADATTRFLRRTYPEGLFQPPARVAREVRFLPNPSKLLPFSALDLDGREVSSSSWLGKAAIVNFWATWCLPCRKEIPALVSLQTKFGADLAVVGVLDDEASTEFVRAFGAGLGVNYPIVRTSSAIERSFSQVLVFPTTYMVDTAGRIVYVHVGEIDPDLVDRQVQALLMLRGERSGPPLP